MPTLSQTESEALQAGEVWWDAELFSGNPDWKKLHNVKKPKLSDEEQAFLDGPCQELCGMIDDWKINHEDGDLPTEVWQFLRDNKFFWMIIPKSHGGLEFSSFAHSEIVRFISTRSVAAAVTVMVPNSLGPGELLHQFGTDDQKDYWLPRLADGRELPAFGLTSAEAGSDASSMVDEGVICKGQWDGEEVLGIRLNWAKCYITLSPICTVLGLAFKLRDPDGLLGDTKDIGITCALVPTDLDGVEAGRRHIPSSTMFLNGPTTGKDVFIQLENIIGGPDFAGKGWMMLMSALAAGRGISLPSMGCAAIALSAHTTGAYARIRQQFNLPIGKFGGVQARMGKLAADSYAMDAARHLTCAGLDEGRALSVISAIMKAHATFSLSCNTDISADLFQMRAAGDIEFVAVGEVNDALPFMGGPDATLAQNELAMLLEPEKQIDLFSAVRRPVSDVQHAIGLHVSRLIVDGGTLQIGIGAIGDAAAHALLLRDAGRVDKIWQTAPFPVIGDGTKPFSKGLYAVTEMLVGGLLALFEKGVLRREVDGAAIHAGFFVEARDLYRRLREMAPAKRSKIAMKPVSFTNALYHDEAAKRAARVDARFINGAMQVSLLGDAMSDSAKPGQVVSGVGGQFNFFEQAFALDGGHAILTLPATRHSDGRTTSNIVWQLPLTTVPRHMRDVVVTEYGTAFLRGQTDETVIKRLISIADSRFQPELLETARKHGKLAQDWEIPPQHRNNTPHTLQKWLRPFRDDLLPDFPLGTDFDAIEKTLLPVLERLGDASADKAALIRLMLGTFYLPPHPQEGPAMQRMRYDAHPSLAEPLQSRALRGALRSEARSA